MTYHTVSLQVLHKCRKKDLKERPLHLRSLYMHFAELHLHGSYSVCLHKNLISKTFLQADFFFFAFFLVSKIIFAVHKSVGFKFILNLAILLIIIIFIVTFRGKMEGNKVKVHTKASKQLLLALKNKMG